VLHAGDYASGGVDDLDWIFTHLAAASGDEDLSFIIINHNNLNRNDHHHQPGEEAKKETIQYSTSDHLA